MNHTEFFSSLKSEAAKRCYLFEGEEEYVKNTAIIQLRKKLIGDNFPEMNDIRLNDPDAGQIIAANETLFEVQQAAASRFAAAVRRTATDGGDGESGIRIEAVGGLPRDEAKRNRKKPGGGKRPGRGPGKAPFPPRGRGPRERAT